LLEVEFSGGMTGDKVGYGLYTNFIGNWQKVNVSAMLVYASKDYPGYYTNSLFYTVNGNWRITRRLSFNANIWQDYQNAAREAAEIPKEDLDWIGIRATRLNAELVRSIFGDEAHKKVIHDPDEEIDGSKRVVIGAGFEPGSSTDLRAVQLARRFGAVRVINMSNIDYVYSADPKKEPNAERLERISWSAFRKLVGDEWDPGLNMPFDPIASREAEKLGLEVVIIGNDVVNLEKLLRGEAFKGTTIS
jgi:uridylate kinase